MDLENRIWEIVTNYYRAKVKLETIELPLIAKHLIPGNSDGANGVSEWDALFERNIQSVVYYIESEEVSKIEIDLIKLFLTL